MLPGPAYPWGCPYGQARAAAVTMTDMSGPRPCVICGKNASSRRGEHVWPQWFLKRMDQQGPPPFAWAKNGVPIVDRKGNAVHRATRQRVLLDVCEPCNTALNTRFEVPAKPVVGDLALNGWKGVRSEDEWRVVGLWWAKVILMLGHPAARIGDALLNREAKIGFDGPLPDYTWMVDGSGPPSDLSVFAFNADLSLPAAEPGFRLTVPADVLHEDGTTTHCQILSLATPGLCVTVLNHPGITIDHPLVKRGEGWELLHSPPSGADLSTLPPMRHKHVLIVRGGGMPAGHVVDESGFSFLTGIFGIGYESAEAAADGGPLNGAAAGAGGHPRLSAQRRAGPARLASGWRALWRRAERWLRP